MSKFERKSNERKPFKKSKKEEVIQYNKNGIRIVHAGQRMPRF